MSNSVLSDLRKYSISDIFLMGYSFVLTKLFYPGALLIRRPISVRQKSGLKYGKGFTTGRNCRIEIFGDGEIVFGDSCLIGDNVHIVASNRVSIGSECLFASKIFISDTSHGSYGRNGSNPDSNPNNRPLVANAVSIGDRVWLGENVVVLAGTNIGNGCIIGANAVVTHDIPDYCIAVGSPAKVIKEYNFENGEWMPADAVGGGRS